MSLNNKHILLGISGGIAAYKSAVLARLLIKAGARVRVVMTAGGQAFVTPLTFQALTGEPVRTELLDPEHEAAMGHIELARWADAILVAPASANLMARLAAGRADDLLTTLCLAAKCPVMLAPAMNQQMWAQASTQDNLQQLRQRGVDMFGPADGDQACGDVGPGRMREPEELLADIEQFFDTGELAGKRVLITAGPTREPIDPVRYISNRSSGRMGYALAQAAVEAGADVVLVSGPVNIETPSGLQCHAVQTAQQMHDCVMQQLQDGIDVFIGVAAVSDYTVAEVAGQKIKKSESSDELNLRLVKNPDILANVARHDRRPYCVGFAAETQDLERYARGKLERKNIDMIAANLVGDGKAFGQDENELHVFWNGGQQKLPMARKDVLARSLISLIAQTLKTKD